MIVYVFLENIHRIRSFYEYHHKKIKTFITIFSILVLTIIIYKSFTFTEKLKRIVSEDENIIRLVRRQIPSALLWAKKPLNYGTMLYLTLLSDLKHGFDKDYGADRYRREVEYQELPTEQLQCVAKKRVQMKTISGSDMAFAPVEWNETLPKNSIEDEIPKFRTCAIVASSNSLMVSEFGKEIDSHDAVFRFGEAPTKDFVRHVGKKTTVRIINAYFLSRYRKKAIEAIADSKFVLYFNPSFYPDTLKQWYKKPESNSLYDLPELIKKYKDKRFFIINPKSIWNLYDFIQDYNLFKMNGHIPTSGAISTFIALKLCDEVKVYGYLPSHHTDIKYCYYYSKLEDLSCTYGGFHSTSQEKNIISQLNTGSEEDVVKFGKVTIPGFSKLSCNTDFETPLNKGRQNKNHMDFTLFLDIY